MAKMEEEAFNFQE